jgi:TolB protein
VSARAQAPVPPPPAGDKPIKEIVIGGGNQRLAVPDCVARAGDEPAREACRKITEVLRSDLRFEDLSIVPESLYAALPTLNPDAIKFDDWKSIGAQVLVITRAQITGGQLLVETRVYDVASGDTMMAKRYSNKPDNPRIFAHQSADDIMAMANIRGVARSKIAFVSDRDSAKGKKSKEIYIVDYDGYGPRRVTVNRSLNLLPSFSPDGRALAYISYRTGFPELFTAWIYEGRSAGFGASGGSQILAHAFGPDGKRMAYASNKSGNTDIWMANANGSDARRLTTSAAIDTAPAWSPTGNEIAFTSQRSGTPQIWVMDSDGLNPRRVTNVGNYNDAASWNPAKEYSEIAYTSRLEGGFEIAVVDLASGQVRQITQGRGSCESPTWAPNGRHLAFACDRGGRFQLGISDRLGRTIKMIDAGPGNNVQPDWGP